MGKWEPKTGDVVSLKSNPEHAGVVTGYDTEKKMYNIVWVKPDGDPAGIMLVGDVLQKAERIDSSTVLAEYEERINALTEELATMRGQVEDIATVRTELAKRKREAIAIVSEVKVLLPEITVDADDSALACMALLRAASTWRSEGNEQIAALQKELASRPAV